MLPSSSSVKDESSVKSTATNPIFDQFFETLLIIQILRYFIDTQTGIQTPHISIFRQIRQLFP